VEQTQGIAHFSPVVPVLEDVESLGVFNEAQGPPEGPCRVQNMVPAVFGQEHPGHLEAAAGAEELTGKTPVHMLGHGAKVPHDQLRLPKHLRIQTLQDKSGFPRDLPGCSRLNPAHRYQEGVIDITAAIFPDVQDYALRGELRGYGKKMVQGFASGIEPSTFNYPPGG